jgi:hypothetical protein
MTLGEAYLDMKSRKILALEMRDSELLALEATRTPTSVKVTNFGRFNLSEAVADDDLGNALKTLLRAHGFTGKSVLHSYYRTTLLSIGC